MASPLAVPSWLDGLLNLESNPAPLIAAAGRRTTPNGQSSWEIVGSTYWDPTAYQLDREDLSLTVKWKAILQTSAIGNAANIALWDVSGITNKGVPQLVPLSTLSYSASLTETFVETELPALEVGSALTGPGVLRTVLWLQTPTPGLIATTFNAWLEPSFQ